MKGKITILSLAILLCSASAEANPAKRVIQRATTSAECHKIEKAHELKALSKKGVLPTQKRIFSQAVDQPIILTEDFSKFTAGSETAPDAVDLADSQTGIISAEYTQTEGWQGIGIYQAGGSAYIGKALENGTPVWVINTPDLKLPNDKQAFQVNFRAKSENAEGDQLSIISLDLSNEPINSDKLTITNEWNDYSVTLRGDDVFYFQIYTDAYGFLLDDVSVSTDALQPPVNITVNGFNGTSATVKWDAVENAESYIVHLWYADYNANMWKSVRDIPTTATSLDITDLETTKDYAVTVSAVKGGTSIESDIVEVAIPAPKGLTAANVTATSFTIKWNPIADVDSYYFGCGYYDENGTIVPLDLPTSVTATSVDVTGVDLLTHTYTIQVWGVKGEIDGTPSEELIVHPQIEAPAVLPASSITQNGFTANWKAVEFGQKYTVNVFTEFEAATTSPYDLLNTAFDFIEEGQESSPVTYSEYKVGSTGWVAENAACATGMLGLDSSWGDFGWYGLLYSPDMDFSRNGGKTTLKLKWKGDSSADKVKIYYAKSVDGTSQQIVSSLQILSVPKDFTEQEITLVGGEDNSSIVIAPETGIVWIDEMEVSTVLESGEKVIMSLTGQTVENATSCVFSDLSIPENHRVFYNVTAGFAPTDGWSKTVGETSENSYVNFDNGGIADANSESANAYISSGILNVVNPNGEKVEVYSANGSLITTNFGNSQIALPAKGVYIVRIGNKVIKVIK